MFRLLPLAVACLLHAAVQAQEQFGVVNGNYDPTDAVMLNPARIAGQWPYAQVRAMGAHLFVWNDLVAMTGSEHTLAGEIQAGIKGAPSVGLGVRGSFHPDDKEGFVQVDLNGPAASVALGKGTIAAGIRARSCTSISGVPTHLGRFIYEGLNYGPQLGIRYHDQAVKALSAGWAQIDLSYARILHQEDFGMWSAGATVRYLQGIYGAGVQFDVLDYTVIDSMRADIHEATGSYGYAAPALGAGQGWGADLGVTYERTLEECERYLPHQASTGCDPMGYRYRIGMSLIDLGRIKYGNAVAGSFSDAQAGFSDYTAVDVPDAGAADSLFSGSLDRWTDRTELLIGTPTALSLQADLRVVDKVYVALDAVQQISGAKGTRLRRPNSIALVPRVEMKRFAAAIPVVLTDDDARHPSVGIMLRMNDLVIGSDNVLPFFTRRDVRGADIYLALRWTIFRSPYCRGKRKGRKHLQPGSMEALPCLIPE
ncbi:MAG: hypothetical protein H6594_02220 [Flavobacteriales bacterium]|nr:hypothetical protein [Flavobacteriales bacterium]